MFRNGVSSLLSAALVHHHHRPHSCLNRYIPLITFPQLGLAVQEGIDEGVLSRVRHICLAFPETTERLSHGAPTSLAGARPRP